MQKIFFIAALAIVLSACDRTHQEEGRTSPAPQIKSAVSKNFGEATAAVDEIANVLERIRGQAALSLRYDRPRTIKQAVERQVYVEMLGSTAAETEAFAVAAFEAAGFSTRRGLDDQNGVRMQFRKAGVEHINALIRDQRASPPFEDPAGTSSMYLRQIQR